MQHSYLPGQGQHRQGEQADHDPEQHVENDGARHDGSSAHGRIAAAFATSTPVAR